MKEVLLIDVRTRLDMRLIMRRLHCIISKEVVSNRFSMVTGQAMPNWFIMFVR
jgi:hypothetical protein